MAIHNDNRLTGISSVDFGYTVTPADSVQGGLTTRPCDILIQVSLGEGRIAHTQPAGTCCHVTNAAPGVCAWLLAGA